MPSHQSLSMSRRRSVKRVMGTIAPENMPNSTKHPHKGQFAGLQMCGRHQLHSAVTGSSRTVPSSLPALIRQILRSAKPVTRDEFCLVSLHAPHQWLTTGVLK